MCTKLTFRFTPPEVKTSGCQRDKSTKGTQRQRVFSFSPFSGLVFSEAGGFNLWRRGRATTLKTLTWCIWDAQLRVRCQKTKAVLGESVKLTRMGRSALRPYRTCTTCTQELSVHSLSPRLRLVRSANAEWGLGGEGFGFYPVTGMRLASAPDCKMANCADAQPTMPL
jgi:hypothetical protein